MSLPLVSIIIPTCNRGHFLDTTLESLFSQDYPAKEIIVVDDGSTDNTSEICARHPVRYFHQENRGVSAARNVGVGHCKGELLLFFDSDDLCPPGSLRRRVELWQAEPQYAHHFGKMRRFRGDAADERDFIDPEDGAVYILCLGAGILTRHSFEHVGGFNEEYRMAEDVDLWLRLREAGFPHKFSTETNLLYRLHKTNATRDLTIANRGFLNVLRMTIRRRREMKKTGAA